MSHDDKYERTKLADELEALGAQATPGPWAWDQRGEKVNEWALGTAFDENEKPLSGRFEDENAIYDEYVCSHEAATCNYKDPALICALRNHLPAIIAALRSTPSATPPSDKHGELVSRLRARKIVDAFRGITRGPTEDESDAADRIEQLERELAEAQALNRKSDELLGRWQRIAERLKNEVEAAPSASGPTMPEKAPLHVLGAMWKALPANGHEHWKNGLDMRPLYLACRAALNEADSRTEGKP